MKDKKLPLRYLIMFLIAIGLLLGTTISGARAALTIFSPDYVSDFEMFHIGITLLESNDKDTDRQVGWRNYTVKKDSKESTTATGTWIVNNNIPLFSDIPANGLVIGKLYNEKYTVQNSGQIDEYVRVIIHKFWADNVVYDSNGAITSYKKDTSLKPSLIECTLDTSEGWIVDTSETTDERVILYYNMPISIGKKTPEFMTNLKINDEVRNSAGAPKEEPATDEKGNPYTKIIYSYPYEGKTFIVEMEADAVQTHNAADAIRSAWGRKVLIDESTKELTLQ